MSFDVCRCSATHRIYLEKLGFKQYWVDTIIAHVSAVRHLCREYYVGTLTKEENHVPDAHEYQRDPVAALTAPKLSHEQRRALDAAKFRLSQLSHAKRQTTEEAIDEAFHQIAEHSSMIFVGGPPGTGKTFVADLCIDYAHQDPVLDFATCFCIICKCFVEIALAQEHLSVAFALPTGQQASRMRSKYPGSDHIAACLI